MFTVTVTRHGTSQYRISGSEGGPCRYASQSDPGLAAAEAVNLAQQSKDGHYVIFGPSDVMGMIPDSVKSK